MTRKMLLGLFLALGMILACAGRGDDDDDQENPGISLSYCHEDCAEEYPTSDQECNRRDYWTTQCYNLAHCNCDCELEFAPDDPDDRPWCETVN